MHQCPAGITSTSSSGHKGHDSQLRKRKDNNMSPSS